jgi:cupin fold WbuC family metalloprotein
MKYKEKSPEVLIADEDVIKAARSDVEFLKKRTPATARRRARFCAHKSGDEPIHEMLIVLMRGTYIRPHKHLAKVESFHIIEGEADVVLFDDEGNTTEIVRMGDYASGRNFYYRLSRPMYHTVVLRSELVVIHETTNGPFKPEETIFAPWSPDEKDETAARAFMKKISDMTEAAA